MQTELQPTLDRVTGLHDRTSFDARLNRYAAEPARQRQTAALLRLDIDRFSHLNESFGVQTGDEVLRSVARCLRECVPNALSIARIGDDEFAVLIEKVDAGTARLIADDALRLIQRRVRVADLPLSVTASLGVCELGPERTPPVLALHAAGLALRESKRRGPNACHFFTSDLLQSCEARTELEASLRRALAAREFRLHFQPQINLGTGDVVGAEALLRWADPTRGMVPPGAFISVAESAGLIGPIGEWVIREVCRRQARRLARGLATVPIAVNVSALQFHDPSFAEMISAELRIRDLPGQLLSLEITESVLMRDVEVVASTMRALATHGVRLALDDFGTGFSSLAYLKRLPLYRLKIDRCFVSELPASRHDAAIIQAVLSLARHLEVEVVAEGVETSAQAEFLRKHGCHIAQGFLWGQPLTGRDFQLLLNDVSAPSITQVSGPDAVTPGVRRRRVAG